MDLAENPYQMGFIHGQSVKLANIKGESEAQVLEKLRQIVETFRFTRSQIVTYKAGFINAWRYTK